MSGMANGAANGGSGVAGEIRLDGRVVVVTGAGGGLGRAHALLLARRGASVVVNDVGGGVDGRGRSSAADVVVAEIEAAGGTAVASTDTVTTAEGGDAIIATALRGYGRVDAVVHNAGILRDRSVANLSPDDVDSVLDVHLRGGFHVARPAFAAMKGSGGGHFVLTSSASGLFGNIGQANYAAAKTGLIGLMHVLALEGARYGIVANAIAPTAATRMTDGLLGDLADRFDPAQVAAVVAFLVSERCTFTHRILSVGGGRVARIVIGVNQGWYGGPGLTTPEQVAANLEEIMDVSDLVIPDTGQDEVELIHRALAGGPAAAGEA